MRLKTVTDKASIQALERLDCPVPSKFPQKPMVELIAGSNVWYQGYVMKESANEAKVRFPGRWLFHWIHQCQSTAVIREGDAWMAAAMLPLWQDLPIDRAVQD